MTYKIHRDNRESHPKSLSFGYYLILLFGFFALINFGILPAKDDTQQNEGAKITDLENLSTAEKTDTTKESSGSSRLLEEGKTEEMIKLLKEREEMINLKEKEISEKMKDLEFLKKQVDQKLEELKSLREEIKSYIQKYDAKRVKDSQHLVKVYESMTPEKAAAIFEEMDLKTAIQILSGLDQKKAGKILNFVSSKKAIQLGEAIGKSK